VPYVSAVRPKKTCQIKKRNVINKRYAWLAIYRTNVRVENDTNSGVGGYEMSVKQKKIEGTASAVLVVSRRVTRGTEQPYTKYGGEKIRDRSRRPGRVNLALYAYAR